MAKRTKSGPQGRQYWLFKSEPDVFSITDLGRQSKRTTYWDGVRNYQARNFLRDTIRLGDRVLFYHSNADPMSIAGTAEVVKAGYPDDTAFDPKSDHFDAKSRRDNPTWYMVDIRLLQIFPRPVTRNELKACAELRHMMLLRPGARLSIQPVTATEWRAVHQLAGVVDEE